MAPPPSTHTNIVGKSWSFVDLKMAANEDALNEPKFELEITGIIHVCVSERLDHKTKNLKIDGKKIIIPWIFLNPSLGEGFKKNEKKWLDLSNAHLTSQAELWIKNLQDAL